jgi:ribosomal protein S7
MEDTVDSADGKKAVSDVIDEAFEITIAEMTGRTMDELVQEVLVEALENVKQRVAVKKWANE